MTSPQSQNPYVYCVNNPLRYVDPTGMEWTHVIVGGGGQEQELWFDNGGSGEYGAGYYDSHGNLYIVPLSTIHAQQNNSITGSDVRNKIKGVPDCATYGGGGALGPGVGGGTKPSIYKPGTPANLTFDDYFNAFDGWDNGSTHVTEWGSELNFVFFSVTYFGLHDEGEWDFQSSIGFGLTGFSWTAYGLDTPFETIAEAKAYSYSGNAVADIDIVYCGGIKARHYEDYGVRVGPQIGWSPIPASGALSAITSVTGSAGTTIIDW